MKEITKKELGVGASDLVLFSVGACVALPTNKKQAQGIFIAYRTSSSAPVRFIFTEFLKKGKLHNRETLLNVICEAEKVKHVTYVDDKSREKDIYFCREENGEIIDAVERDFERNAFVEGFSEIMATKLHFSSSLQADKVKSDKVYEMDIRMNMEANMEMHSYEFAVINAYNACLLGGKFYEDIMQLETRDGRRVKIEVRRARSEYVEDAVMYVQPVFGSVPDVVEHYLTETFHYIDGENIYERTFKISYTARLNDYKIMQV